MKIVYQTYSGDRFCNKDEVTNFKFWFDKNFMSCSDYGEANWCTLDGQYGTHWNEKWKSIEANSMDGYGIFYMTAWNCPQCGCIGLLYEYNKF